MWTALTLAPQLCNVVVKSWYLCETWFGREINTSDRVEPAQEGRARAACLSRADLKPARHIFTNPIRAKKQMTQPDTSQVPKLPVASGFGNLTRQTPAPAQHWLQALWSPPQSQKPPWLQSKIFSNSYHRAGCVFQAVHHNQDPIKLVCTKIQ